MKKLKIILSNLLFFLGIEIFLSPIIIYWFMNGDYDRYIWIINGPFPFSNFGGGPFQLLMYSALCVSGVFLIILSLILKELLKINKE